MDIFGFFKFFFFIGMVILIDFVELDLLVLGLGVFGWWIVDVFCILLCMFLDLICLGFVLIVSKEFVVLVFVKDRFVFLLLVMISCCVWIVWV